MALKKGVVNVEDVAPVVVNNAEPPVELAYHLKVPATAVDALMFTVPGEQEIPLVPVTPVAVPMLAVTAVRGVVVHTGDAVVNVT